MKMLKYLVLSMLLVAPTASSMAEEESENSAKCEIALGVMYGRPYLLKKQRTEEEFLKRVGMLSESLEKYKETLDHTNTNNFKGLNLAPEVVAQLANSLSDTKAVINSLGVMVKELQTDPASTGKWVVAFRDFFTIKPDIEQLCETGVVKSEEHLLIGMWMLDALDYFVIPSLDER